MKSVDILTMSLRGLSSERIRKLLEGADPVQSKPASQESIFGLGKEDAQALEAALSPIQAKDRFYASWSRFLDGGGSYVTIQDPGYPEKLREIPNPPVILYLWGSMPAREDFCLAVIGSRNPSDYGRKVAADFSRKLAQAGACLISGLAYGIDSICHRASLDAKGRTLAILGSGFDAIYPSSHQSLAQEIRQNGCLITEYPPWTKARPYRFVYRNRLISGLSDGVLVVEAGKKSGTLITVRSALDQGREVFCIPGNITQPRSQGTNQLIQEGAFLVTQVEDILSHYKLLDQLPKKTDRLRPVLTGAEGRVYDRLLAGPASLQQLLGESQLDPGQLFAILTDLEVKGYIQRQSPGSFAVKEE